MKRDLDFVRSLMLRIESGHHLSSSDVEESDSDGSNRGKLSYHLNMMINEAGLVRGSESAEVGDEDQEVWDDLELTWRGHDFLDQVRDEEVWRQAKAGVSAAKGFTFDLLVSVAKAYVTAKIKQQMGIPFDV